MSTQYPIPLTSINPFSSGQDTWRAYDVCLALQSLQEWKIFKSDLEKPISKPILLDMNPPLVARVLGHALVLAPNENGRDALTREILGCNGDHELLAGLAHLYVKGLIRVFKNPKGPTPAISVDQSPRLSFTQAVQEQDPHILRHSLTSSKELRSRILFRDKNTCILTGAKEGSLLEPSDIDYMFEHGIGAESTTVSHIISQSISDEIQGNSRKVQEKVYILVSYIPSVIAHYICFEFEWAKSAAAIIERFGGFSPHDILGGDVLNSPANAFLSTFAPHAEFDRLSIWLESARDVNDLELPDVYNVNHYRDKRWLSLIGRGIKEQVRFTSATTDDGVFIPPPHRSLLALHAACARIAHMSGAAEYLDYLYREPDSIMTMTESNAPAELTRILTALQLAPAKA
ncbi:hypothetical protein AN958_05284 [Leucoagaricus sp. SymC.cos]|nr:hypothetical protein AN958_05284 [Leucoagaricus sp. SymC.cos]